MTQPLALILCQRVVPVSQLVNRMQDLGYRVQPLSDPALLLDQAQQAKPMLVIADLAPGEGVCAHLEKLKENSATSHLPIIGFGADPTLEERARKAGATLLVTETALLAHLPQFLEQALQLD